MTVISRCLEFFCSVLLYPGKIPQQSTCSPSCLQYDKPKRLLCKWTLTRIIYAMYFVSVLLFLKCSNFGWLTKLLFFTKWLFELSRLKKSIADVVYVWLELCQWSFCLYVSVTLNTDEWQVQSLTLRKWQLVENHVSHRHILPWPCLWSS